MEQKNYLVTADISARWQGESLMLHFQLAGTLLVSALAVACGRYHSAPTSSELVEHPLNGKTVALAFHGQYLRHEILFHAKAEGCSNYFNVGANISGAIVAPLEEAGAKVSGAAKLVNGRPENRPRFMRRALERPPP